MKANSIITIVVNSAEKLRIAGISVPKGSKNLVAELVRCRSMNILSRKLSRPVAMMKLENAMPRV